MEQTVAERLAIKAAQNNQKTQQDILNHYRSTGSKNWEQEQQEKIRNLIERNKRQW